MHKGESVWNIKIFGHAQRRRLRRVLEFVSYFTFRASNFVSVYFGSANYLSPRPLAVVFMVK